MSSPTLTPPALTPPERARRLRELAAVFLRLGTTAFGGPAAHVAMMDQEVVRHRRWLDRQEFLDLLGATNLIPGPNSTELAIHLGYRRAGLPGLVVAGACFILPAMLLVWALAAAYTRYQAVPELNWLLYGVKPVILAIVVQALWGLGRSAVKNGATGVAGAGVAALAALGVHELVLLLAAGLGVMLAANARRLRDQGVAGVALPALPTLAAAAAVPAAAVPVTLTGLTLFFVKVGSVLYGSGYVLLAFLRADLVERWGWLTSQQLLDAIAVGQFTPGPVFTTATFVGYLVAGSPGALLATLGIFLPAFVFVWASHPFLPRLRRSPWAAGFLDGVNAASLGLMATVTWQLASAAVVDRLTAVVALASLAVVLRLRVNSAWLVLAGGLVGLGTRLLSG